MGKEEREGDGEEMKRIEGEENFRAFPQFQICHHTTGNNSNQVCILISSPTNRLSSVFRATNRLSGKTAPWNAENWCCLG